MQFGMFGLLLAGMSLLAGSSATMAQDVPASLADPSTDAGQPHPVCDCVTLPAFTVVQLELTSHLGSRISKSGETFEFKLAAPVEVDSRTVIPVGTGGAGEVIHAKKAGGSGAPGELVLAARYLDLEGQRIRLRSMNYFATGKNDIGSVNTLNTVAAATVPVLSIVGFLSHGGEVDLPVGTHATAKTAEPVTMAWASNSATGPASPPAGDQAIPPATGEVK